MLLRLLDADRGSDLDHSGTLPVSDVGVLEAAGQEFVCTLGVGVYLNPKWLLSFGGQ